MLIIGEVGEKAMKKRFRKRTLHTIDSVRDGLLRKGFYVLVRVDDKGILFIASKKGVKRVIRLCRGKIVLPELGEL